jgi:hypothetical protein
MISINNNIKIIVKTNKLYILNKQLYIDYEIAVYTD